VGVNVVPGDPKDWPMYNHDPEGSRYNSAETRLRPDNVGGLQVQWSFPTVGAVAGTPAVVNDVVYAADSEGWVYAINRDGHQLWQHHVSVTPPAALPFPLGLKVSSSLLVTNRTIIFGDLGGVIHGLDADTGAERWSIKPNNHPAASIFGSATMVGNDVAIGISSIEELAALVTPGYQLSFRGSLVLLDPADGHVIWQTYTISDADHAAGATGAAIWSSPTYDRASNTIFVATGNNYTQPTTTTSDALMAIDAADGHIKWVNQRTHDDEWNFRFLPESPEHPDFDFGDSPQVYMLNGQKVVGAGQKSGFYHVVDAQTGATINQFQASPYGQLGGLFAYSAVANGVVFANGVDWPNVFTGGPPLGGSLTAIAGDGSHQLWHAVTPAPDMSGVAVGNGVVYFQSIDGNLYALDAGTGAQLARVFTGGQESGPAVSRGQVYVGTGDILTSLFIPYLPAGPAAIVALGISDPPSRVESHASVAPSQPRAAASTSSEHAIPFRAEASGAITASLPTSSGTLVIFVTHGDALHLGQYDSTGYCIVQGNTGTGKETFTAANGDQFVKFFTGTFEPDGTYSGTFTLGDGTGRFEGISGSGEFTTVFHPDGIDFDLFIVGEILISTGNKR
jgi:polyvinyl alcohol dehydrogenase (cytochrome)